MRLVPDIGVPYVALLAYPAGQLPTFGTGVAAPPLRSRAPSPQGRVEFLIALLQLPANLDTVLPMHFPIKPHPIRGGEVSPVSDQ